MAWTDDLANFLRLNDGEQAYVGYPQMQVGLTKPRQAGAVTGFLEGATGMPSMQPKNPITDPNYEAYEQGKNTGELVNIAMMAAPGYAAALRASAPKAYNALENYMVKTGGIIPLEAYHGTPHTIQGGFDISKVGTGEGAQAYGHGMYFAENPEVAGQYRTALSNIEMSAKGKPLKELGVDERVATHSPGIFENPLDYGLAEYNKSLKTQLLDYPELKNDPNYPKELFDQRIEYLKSWGKGTKEEKAAQAMQNFVKKNGYPDVNVSGNLYKVDIPDEHIPNMLDWDNPVPEDLRKNISKAALEEFGNGATGTSGEHLYKEIVFEMRQKGSNNPEADASAWLAKQGVPGIRYLDQGSRDTGGTSNFVVFDPSSVQILEKNGQPVSRKDIIEEQVNKLKD